MRNLFFSGVAAFILAGAFTGCGSDGGGEAGATEDQMRDPAWAQAKLKELDKEATVPKSKTPAPKK